VTISCAPCRLTLLQFFGVVADRIFKRMLAACCLPPMAEPAKNAASYSDVLLSQPRVCVCVPAPSFAAFAASIPACRCGMEHKLLDVCAGC
jgi:hypothetical protein